MESKLSDLKKYFQPKVLGIGPGGEKGYYYLGALRELKSQGLLDQLKVISGCSIGSIIGLMIVIGMEIKEITKIMFGVSYRDVIQGFGLDSIKEGGLFNIDGLREKIREVIKTKLGYIPNLKQLYHFSGIEFCVSITNTGRKNYRQYLNYKTAPELDCVEAVILSSCVPFCFKRLQYKGDDVIDGAWSDPYPIEPYDDGKTSILGLFIDQQSYLHSPKNSIFSYYNTLFNIPIEIFINNARYSSQCFHLFLTTTVKVKNHLFPSNLDKNLMVNRGNALARGFIQEMLRYFQNSPKETLES